MKRLERDTFYGHFIYPLSIKLHRNIISWPPLINQAIINSQATKITALSKRGKMISNVLEKTRYDVQRSTMQPPLSIPP